MSFKKYCTFILVMALTGCFAGRENNGKGLDAEDPMARSATERSGEPFDWNSFRDREISSFRIMGVDANLNTNTEYINPETEQHEAVAIDFTVVLEHRGTAQRLLGHRFRVSGFHGEEVFNLEVQENNIIRWTEVVEFDPLRPQFDPVLVIKKIEGLGASNGSTHAIFELNPWAYFNGDLGRPFFDLTYSVDTLNARYSNFDPSFNYIRHMQDPQTEAPSLNIGSARFYINREETSMIMSDISSSSPVQMYEPSSLEARAERERIQIPLESDSMVDIDRGDLADEPERNYVSRDQIIERFANEGTPARGVRLKLGANLSLQTEVSNGGATTTFNAINSGRFRVFAALVGSNQGLYSDMGDEEKILLGINAAPVVAEVNDQILNVEFEMFTNNITNRGDLDLAIKVVPLQRWADAGVKPFSVVYKLGTFGDLLGFGGDFRDIESSPTDFDFEEYLGDVRDFTDRHKTWLLDNGFLAEAHDILFDSMRIKFRTVKAGETATQRTVIFDVTSCPREGLSGRRLTEGRQFKVLVSGLDPLKCNPREYFLPNGDENPVCRFDRVPIEQIRQDGGSGAFEVQNTGCLAWVDEIAHKYYQRENLIERSYHIVDPLTNEEIFKLDGYFNPWDEKFGTLGVDARNLSESFIEEIRSREKLPSRFFVGDFSYMTLRFRYDIDENMHLTVRKTVLLNLYPFVKRYSNIINGINGNFPIRDGVYLLKIAYQKDYIDPGADGIDLQRTGSGENVSTRVVVENGNTGANRHDDPFVIDDLRRKTFVHIIKKLIRVENNRVISPVEFHIDELRTLRVRSNLLLQLEPINQYKLQIVNLLERHIAHKLGLEIGDLGAVRCLRPGFLDALLELFQKTIDEIALSIPDDINYTSEDSFRQVIESEDVIKALSNLTDSGLLDGLSSAFSLSLNEGQLRDAFRFLSGGDLSGLESTDELRQAIEQAREQQTLLGQQQTLGILGQLSGQASRGIVLDPDDEGLRDHEGFITPLNSDSYDDLTPDAQAQAPDHALGSDAGEVGEAVEALEGALDSAGVNNGIATQVDEHTDEFLEEVTRQQELSTLLNNDFTIDPSIARVSDLDYLIDRKAGIIRRTFVGPLTLLALDNKNVMNATDALDYANSSNDGAQDQSIRNSYGDDFNSDYARNPNFGYQGHFKNCHVDDFIVEDKHEELVHNAWAECVSSLKDATGEVRIPKDFTCDYEQTNVYQDYLSRQTDAIWSNVDEYNSSPFKRFSRHADEVRMVNEGRCPYREIWLKKFFAQKMAEKARSQFGNFLAFPTITAKVVQPIDEDVDYRSTSMRVQAVEERCIDQGMISEDCIRNTNRFNLSVADFTNSILDSENIHNVGDYFVSPRSELDDTPYKNVLEEFYSKYNRSILRSMVNGSEESKNELSKDIYKTLVQIAAPPVELYPRIQYEDKLEQIAPADFGRNVQEFLCNIMLPRADKSFHEFFEMYDEANSEDIESSGYNFDSNRRALYRTFKDKMNKCRERARAAATSVEIASPFRIERKFRTLELGRYFFRGGKSINFTVSQGVGVSHGITASNKYSLDPINSFKDLIYKIPGVGQVAGFFAGMFKLHDYQQSESNGVSDNVGLGTSAHLSMQAAELDLELLRYRRCMLVRWNKEFLSDIMNHKSIIQAFSNRSELNAFQDIIPAMNNIFVCGAEDNTPVAIRENYYYVTQHFTEGDLLDSGSLLNNPWLLTLRGYRDMVAFVKSIYPEDNNFLGDQDGDGQQDGLPVLQLMRDDLERMTSARPFFVPVTVGNPTERSTFRDELNPWQTMSIGYRNVTPSFPGLFTQLSNREVSIPNWPWTNEGQLRSQGDRSCSAELERNHSDQDGEYADD